MNGIQALIKETPQDSSLFLLPCEVTAKQALPKHRICQHLDLGLLGPEKPMSVV